MNSNFTVGEKALPNCALGTWSWGKGMNGSGMVFGNKVTEDVLAQTYEEAVKCGIELFDTAAVYGAGTSEALLGRLIKDNKDVIISTKYMPEKSEKDGRIEASLEASLSHLGVDCIDIFWLHSPINIEKNMEKMAQFVLNGKIKAIGLSNCSVAEINLAQRTLKKYGCSLFGVQNHYSLIYRCSEQKGVLDWCRENGAAFFAYMILEQGALTGAQKLPTLSRRGLAFTKSRIEKLSPLIDVLKSLGEKYNVKPAQIAIAHSISKGMIPLIGATKPYQAAELAEAAKLTLTEDEVLLLERTADSINVSVKAQWEKELTDERE